MAERLGGRRLGAASRERTLVRLVSCRRHECTEARLLADAPRIQRQQRLVCALQSCGDAGSAGGFSQSMEAEMGSRAKRGWRAAVHLQYGTAHVSRRRSLLDVSASLHWPR
jgi:hypothetical protein